MNSSSSESLFQKLAKYADTHKKAKCYWVQILAQKSFVEPWVGIINGKEYSHSRVYKISGDKFYELLTGEPQALFQIYQALPRVIKDYKAISKDKLSGQDIAQAWNSIKADSDTNQRDPLSQIAWDNFDFYKGFDDL